MEQDPCVLPKAMHTRSSLPRASLLRGLALVALAPAAHADLNSWVTQVGTGTPAAFSMLSITQPDSADIGVINGTGQATYEFVINGTDAGQSSALMGIRNSGVADNCAIKFEQWPDTGRYGLTLGGVADYSGSFATYGADVVLAFVVDHAANQTELFEDGVSVHVFPYAPHLSGLVGLGQWFDVVNGNHVDLLTGTIHGVAVYDTALPGSEIETHANAFHGAGSVGASYCGPAVANSTGAPATIVATGSANVVDNFMTLEVSGLPTNVFGMCLAGLSQGNTPSVGGGQGTLCITPPLAMMTTHVMSSGGSGSFQVPFDMTQVTVPGWGLPGPGQTWYFQAWYRDQNPLHTTNMTDGYFVMFQ